MLNKNIYLVYPAGYSGSYVSWCLSKSEASLKDATVDNPVNVSKTDKYGGVGTSHLHHRLPTHCSIEQLMFWQILHQPKEKRIYLLNAWDNFWLIKTIHYIMAFDRDPLIIQISAEDNDYNVLGHINAVTKWPLFFDIQAKEFNLDFYNLDPNNLEHRNNLVKNYEAIFTMPKKLDVDDNKSIPNFKQIRGIYNNWYNVRSTHNPHEVNEEQFVKPTFATDNLYHLDLKDLYSQSLLSILESIMKDNDVGDFDFEYVKSFHQTYIDAQQHLKFVEEINEFRKTKVLTEYLNSHPLLQARVIKEIYNQLPSDWESKTLQEIVKAL